MRSCLSICQGRLAAAAATSRRLSYVPALRSASYRASYEPTLTLLVTLTLYDAHDRSAPRAGSIVLPPVVLYAHGCLCVSPSRLLPVVHGAGDQSQRRLRRARLREGRGLSACGLSVRW